MLEMLSPPLRCSGSLMIVDLERPLGCFKGVKAGEDRL